MLRGALAALVCRAPGIGLPVQVGKATPHCFFAVRAASSGGWRPVGRSALAASSRASQSRDSDADRVFVSSHYRISEEKIMEFVQRHKLAIFSNTQNQLCLKYCHFCPKPHDNKRDNLNKLYVNKTTGTFFCHRCGSKGTWYDFTRSLSNGGPSVVPALGRGSGMGTQRGEPGHELPKLIRFNERFSENLWKEKDILQWLTGKQKGCRGLSRSVLKKYKVGVDTHSFVDDDNKWIPRKCVVFPWCEYDKDGNLVYTRMKVRGFENKADMRMTPRGGGWGLFGWHTVPDDATDIVLTEGEFDAMAAHQETGMPCVSLPNGAKSLPLEVLPRLERFKKIYLWMDDDMAGREGAEKFAEKLGVGRCFIVSTRDGKDDGPKDANDAMLQGKDLKGLLSKAALTPHDNITTFDALRGDVYSMLTNPNQHRGKQVLSLPGLNRIMKGHRRGELTIFTGQTGSGKTTLLSQLSLDFCKQGVPTLWGSFEIKNSHLCLKMLNQYANVRLAEHLTHFNDYADQFSELPMYFLRSFGSTQIDDVLDAMDYAVYAHDVEHILLDNLQFMLSGQARGYDRYEIQDIAIHKLRLFATERNVHITLVVHPRKEGPDRQLGTASVFGSAKATQEADNVLILQAEGDGRRLDITKNRFDGAIGSIDLQFNSSTLKLYEVYGEAGDEANVSSTATTSGGEDESHSDDDDTYLPSIK